MKYSKIISICLLVGVMQISDLESVSGIRLHDDDVWGDMMEGTNASEFIQDAPKDYVEVKKQKPKIDYKLVQKRLKEEAALKKV